MKEMKLTEQEARLLLSMIDNKLVNDKPSPETQVILHNIKKKLA